MKGRKSFLKLYHLWPFITGTFWLNTMIQRRVYNYEIVLKEKLYPRYKQIHALKERFISYQMLEVSGSHEEYSKLIDNILKHVERLCLNSDKFELVCYLLTHISYWL